MRLDHLTPQERADVWENEARQGYEIVSDLKARVEELEAALRYFTKRLSRNSLHPDDYAALQIADAALRSDRREDQ